MRILLLLFLLMGCVSETRYHTPKNGTCLKLRGSDYGTFVIKHLEDEHYLTLQFDYYSSDKYLYGLGEDDFRKRFYKYIKCPKFNSISGKAVIELENRKEFNNVIKLVKENNRRIN